MTSDTPSTTENKPARNLGFSISNPESSSDDELPSLHSTSTSISIRIVASCQALGQIQVINSPHYTSPRPSSRSSLAMETTLQPATDEDVHGAGQVISPSRPTTSVAPARSPQELGAKRISRQKTGKTPRLKSVLRYLVVAPGKNLNVEADFDDNREEQCEADNDHGRLLGAPAPRSTTGFTSGGDDGSSTSRPSRGVGMLMGRTTSATRQILANGWPLGPFADNVHGEWKGILSDHERNRSFLGPKSVSGMSSTGGSSSPPVTAPQAMVLSSTKEAKPKHRNSTRLVADENEASDSGELKETDNFTAGAANRAKNRSTKSLKSKVEKFVPHQVERTTIKWVKGELIGKGKYYEVFSAMDVITGDILAVKQAEISQTVKGQNDSRQVRVIDALKAEQKTLESLDHPNIVRYLGFEQTKDFFAVLLEYIPGGSIGNRLREHGRFVQDTIKSFMGMIIAGLAYLHDNKIIHRDVKADNILVDQSGICKISNFGISNRSDDAYKNAPMTTPRGSVFWMAPEMLHKVQGKRAYSAKVDIWSLGCVFIEMFTGRVPWEHDDFVSIMSKARKTQMAPPVPDDVILSPEAEDFRQQCFYQDPDDRPTARALQLHKWLVLPTDWRFDGFGPSNSPSLQLVEAAGTSLVLNVEIDSADTHHAPSTALVVRDFENEITFDTVEPFDTRGNFCDLFMGSHTAAGKVALKRLRCRGGDDDNVETMTRQFKRESDIWMTLRHERILQCLGIFTRERSLYLVSPFMKNGSLFDWLRRGEPLGSERLRLIHELADALVYLHARGIVHGDVKSNNVLLSDEVCVQLCDFGLTRLAESATSTSLKGAGTVRWQGPELWEDNPKSFKSDVYAFAMTIVEVLTSQIPFATISNDYTVIKAVSMRDERPAQVPQTSSDGISYSNSWLVAERCWNADPDRRISMVEATALFSPCTENYS